MCSRAQTDKKSLNSTKFIMFIIFKIVIDTNYRFKTKLGKFRIHVANKKILKLIETFGNNII